MNKRNVARFIGIALLASVNVAGYGTADDGCALDDCTTSSASTTAAPVEQETVIQAPIASVDALTACAPSFEEIRRLAFEAGRQQGLREAGFVETAQSSPPIVAAPMPVAPLPAVQPAEKPMETVLVGTVKVRRGWWVDRYVQRRDFKRKGATLDATLLCNGFALRTNPTLMPKQTLKICKPKK